MRASISRTAGEWRAGSRRLASFRGECDATTIGARDKGTRSGRKATEEGGEGLSRRGRGIEDGG